MLRYAEPEAYQDPLRRQRRRTSFKRPVLPSKASPTADAIDQANRDPAHEPRRMLSPGGSLRIRAAPLESEFPPGSRAFAQIKIGESLIWDRGFG